MSCCHTSHDSKVEIIVNEMIWKLDEHTYMRTYARTQWKKNEKLKSCMMDKPEGVFA